MSPLAVLLLSRPVACVMLDVHEATVLECYGRFSVHEVNGATMGFFDNEKDAVQYLQDQMTGDERGGEYG